MEFIIPLLLYCSVFVALFVTPVYAATARVLIYTATERFRHESIPIAVDVLKGRGESIDTEFDATEDASQFTDDNLSGYDALLFLSTTGEVLSSAGKAAFSKYINQGGNFVGIHSASDSLRNTTSYTRELGSIFDYHADLQNFTVDVIDRTHPSTNMLPERWNVRDEVYMFESDPRSIGATVVLAADDKSYIDNDVRRFNHGSPHPLAWYQEKGAGVVDGGIAGRSFYTSLGHLNETWRDELFVSHVLGGIGWVLQGNTTLAFNSSALVGNKPSTASSTSTTSTASSQPTTSSQDVPS
ncbi:trehalose utilization-domain-containing protein [Crassisporium funariophilum]|nr:trehalose utilization-domain-containing protein [Crassisporium funariophilum]